MQAILLAGGKGTRLRPYTTVLPKPLLPIGDYPILEVVVRQLSRAGFGRLVLAVGYHHELLRAFFGDGKRWGLQIAYSLENEPLGTAGPLRCIAELDDHFLMMNGDILTDLRYADLVKFHHASGAELTIATHQRSVSIDYGTLTFDDKGRLSGYEEKPSLSYNVSMGIYVVSRSAVDAIPAGVRFDLPHWVDALLKAGRHVQCYPFDGYWKDIGRREDYESAIEDFERKREEFLR